MGGSATNKDSLNKIVQENWGNILFAAVLSQRIKTPIKFPPNLVTTQFRAAPHT